MSKPHDPEHYRVWFNRLGRGIALVGPSLILLIILATFVTRLFESPEDSAPVDEPGGVADRIGESVQVEPTTTGADDGFTTPAAPVSAAEAENP